jgi:hypothetical protein
MDVDDYVNNGPYASNKKDKKVPDHSFASPQKSNAHVLDAAQQKAAMAKIKGINDKYHGQDPLAEALGQQPIGSVQLFDSRPTTSQKRSSGAVVLPSASVDQPNLNRSGGHNSVEQGSAKKRKLTPNVSHNLLFDMYLSLVLLLRPQFMKVLQLLIFQTLTLHQMKTFIMLLNH